MGRGVHLSATCAVKVDPLAVNPLRIYGYTLARTANAYSPLSAAHNAMFRDSILPLPPPPPTSRMLTRGKTSLGSLTYITYRSGTVFSAWTCAPIP